jgi:Zn-dependent protease
MGWQDRDYNAGREEVNAYLANPLGLIQYALPIWRSSGLHIRLSFWFLLAAIFIVIEDLRGGVPGYILVDLALVLGVCLWHEWGHRLFARMVDGNHWEWVLWPLGGMVAPSSPRTAKAVFVANVGGIAFNALLIGLIIGAGLAFSGHLAGASGSFLPFGFSVGGTAWHPLVSHCLATAIYLSLAMILFNLFPCFWFDGGHIWQAALWPFLGQWKAGMITCLAGMILAAPFFTLSLLNFNLLGMLMWALIFADCFRRRRTLKSAGPAMMDDEEASSYGYPGMTDTKAHRKIKKRWVNAARKRALADQAQQAKIDAILAKVKEKGLHSLNWWEKRTLRKATERQRQQDLAGRL